jgi:hypothetical protein
VNARCCLQVGNAGVRWACCGWWHVLRCSAAVCAVQTVHTAILAAQNITYLLCRVSKREVNMPDQHRRMHHHASAASRGHIECVPAIRASLTAVLII